MPIFGYKRTIVNQEIGLLELREVSLEFNAADLRRLACFLEHFAGQIEQHARRSGHAHLTTFDHDWGRARPEVDVIIIIPDPEPLARLQ
jgi:hypothetical protein